ncbi:sulfite exporter TauE/SafE family protein [Actinomadura parmotrematis]|uniref:Sulfite exporter TauE/SafE family protein n=1 Tax=Actinomadura parmotrematis TaxID=2864039 RepID=A0ABS7G382_9ACTN|nr:sulfite exporter TauE/SafE family protein [Actinomadura parmotrematis]MBW8486113.1 sulfite exporter TauE/SafE family protein [Actinomadura parmotrematis]
MDAAALLAAGAGAGLLAGATSCAAVQLGLLAGAVRGTARPLRPVAVFLAAKLAGHAALGAVLGLAGSAVQPGPQVRGVLLAAAAATLALFALDLLGFGPARRLLRRGPAAGDAHCAPPPPRSRRPALLGLATLAVPCGLTLSAELLAVTSRSPLGGAAVMAGFVAGTAPVFGLVGLTVGRTMALLRGRLSAVLGVALLAVSAWTLMSGLRLGGWLPAGGGTAAADSARFVRTDAAGTQIVTVWALDEGYRPALLDARAGVPTVLELRTRGTRGHTRAFTIPARGEDVVLPVDGTIRVDLGTPRAGRLRFVCASGHFPGAITFR